MDLGDDLDELSKLLDSETFDPAENVDTGINLTQNQKKEPCRKLSTIDIFQEEIQSQNPAEHKKSPPKSKQNVKASEIHDGNTDSSDDEDNKYAVEHQNYTESGRSIKDLFKKQTSSSSFYSASSSSSWKSIKPTPSSTPLTTHNESRDIYRDPFFGIRVM